MDDQTQELLKSFMGEMTPSHSSVVWILDRISMGELLKPGDPLDPKTKAFMAVLWLKTLAEIGESRFHLAFQDVVETSRFRPDIAEIRRAAGINRGIVDPTEQDALRGLRTIVLAFRKHERKLKLNPPYPTFDERTEAAIVDFGDGDRIAGIALLSCHPSLPWSECEPAYRLKATQDLERRWVAAYAGVR